MTSIPGFNNQDSSGEDSVFQQWLEKGCPGLDSASHEAIQSAPKDTASSLFESSGIEPPAPHTGSTSGCAEDASNHVLLPAGSIILTRYLVNRRLQLDQEDETLKDSVSDLQLPLLSQTEKLPDDQCGLQVGMKRSGGKGRGRGRPDRKAFQLGPGNLLAYFDGGEQVRKDLQTTYGQDLRCVVPQSDDQYEHFSPCELRVCKGLICSTADGNASDSLNVAWSIGEGGPFVACARHSRAQRSETLAVEYYWLYKEMEYTELERNKPTMIFCENFWRSLIEEPKRSELSAKLDRLFEEQVSRLSTT